MQCIFFTSNVFLVTKIFMPESSLAKSTAVNHRSEDKPFALKEAAALKIAQNNRPSDEPKTPALSAELAQNWLAWQCQMVTGIISGAIYLPVETQNIASSIAIWPDKSEGEPKLVDAAKQSLTENRAVVLSQQNYGPEGQRTCDQIAFPLLVDNKTVAIASVMISPRSESQQHAILQLMQWGGLWIETLVHQQSLGQQAESSFVLTTMTAILSHPSSHVAAIETVNRLAEQFGCERVSIGFRQGLPIRLQALSHVATFDARTQLVRRIEAAMEEAVDQNTTLVYPANPNQASSVYKAHAELSDQQQEVAVCTIPLRGHFEVLGAITLERTAKNPFEKDTIALCQSVADLVGPALELKQREERSLWVKGNDTLRKLTANVFGPVHLKAKMIMLTLVTLISVLSFVDATYEMTSTAYIEGTVRQLLVAPQKGYVKQAAVRAGDLVKKGQLIALLDESNLQLERQKWQAEHNKIQTEYQEALAKRERAVLSVLRAQLDQVNAEIMLVDEKINRTQLHAPFDGIVVSGDLSQSLGSPVETGQVLYEIAPLDSYRVVLEVEEYDVADLDRGKVGHLLTSAFPRTPFNIVIDQVVPVAISSEKRNFFRVEASLDESAPLLRPGMRGVAKIDMGQHNILWIWTHTIIDRIRLWSWSVGW
jgi:RND family efflux transporter MFP subunit